MHTDLECLYKITVDSDSGAPTCSLDTCGHSDTFDLSALYATDNDAWAADFVEVFQDLIERGYDNLYVPV